MLAPRPSFAFKAKLCPPTSLGWEHISFNGVLTYGRPNRSNRGFGPASVPRYRLAYDLEQILR